MSQENVEVVRSIYDAFNQGDWARALELLDPDFEWIPDERQLLGAVRGRENFRRYLEDQTDVFDETQVEPEEFFEKDDQIVAFIRVRNRGHASGAVVEVRNAHVLTFRAGRLVRGEEYAERDKALEAAGLKE